jgi:hypothetical protein
MTWLTVADQHAAIKGDFKDFRLVADGGWVGVWEGEVKPIGRTYRIRIVYFRRTLFDGFTLENPYVSVYVIDPVIGKETVENERLLPHIYWNEHRPEYPRLCLYDPQQLTWTPELLIAETIIPWASEWLFFYEFWQITGEFKGPGRHPERRRDKCQTVHQTLCPEDRARQDQSRNAAFHRLGRRIGVFASSLLMEAASAGSFPPPSWRDLSGATPADVQSRLASILLQAPRQAAFSRLAWEPASPQPNSSISMSEEGAKSFLRSPPLRSAA